MTSAIDVTVPIYGNPTTKSVRDNFATAHDEIGALQNDVASKVNRNGDAMAGFLSLYLDPELPTHAATKSYVDAMAFTGGGGAVAAQSVTVAPAIAGLPGANVYDALVSTFPKSGGTFTGGISFGSQIGANTGDVSKHISLYDGFAGFSITPNRLNIFAGATLGSGAALFVAINGLDRLAVAEDLISIGAPLVLPGDPASPLHAATKQYVDAKPGGAVIADTPPTLSPGKLWFNSNQTQLYVGYDDGTSSQWVIANNQNVLTTGAINTALQPTYNNVGRNLLHNGLFNIAQRGNGPFNSNGYTVDRWTVWRDTDTGVITRLAISVGGMAFDESSAYYMLVDFTGSAVANAHTVFYQNIEDVRRLAGKTVTVSFYALCWAGSIKLGVSLGQNFGTGGSPSAIVNIAGQSVTLNQAWQRYSVTFTLPSITGKTLGTNDNSLTGLNLFFSSGSSNAVRSGNVGVQTGKVQLWGVQLEIGNVATPLEKPDPQIDLANCQRFYQAHSIIWWSYQAAGAAVGFGQLLPVTMRVAPTVTFSAAGNVNLGSVTAVGQTPGNVYCWALATALGPVTFNGTITASADL